MTMHQTIQQSVEEFREEFLKEFCKIEPYRDTEIVYLKGFLEKNYNLIPTPKTIVLFTKEKHISSHISLIEAEIARKRGMMKDEFAQNAEGQITFGAVRTRVGYNQAIQEDIQYLEGELELIKKLI